MTSREPLPVCLVALCLGIVLDKILSVPPMIWGTLFLTTACVWRLSRAKASREKTAKQKPGEHGPSVVSALSLLGMIAIGGGLWHHLYWNVYPAGDPGLFQLDQPTPVLIEGKVVTSPRWVPAPPDMPGRLMPPSDHTVLTLRVTQLRNGLQWEPACGRVSVSVTGKLPDVHYGDRLRLIGKLAPPNPPQNPGDYDQAATQRQQRVLSLLRVDGAGSVTKLESGSRSIGRQLERLRNGGQANISRYMSPEHASFASAMILGVRDEIDPELSQMLIESGVSHIIAISGLHVGLVSLGFVFLLRLLGLRRKAFALVLAAAMLCYLCMTDMRPSAIRATLLVFVACLSIFRGQRRLQLNAFAATGVIVLAINPTSLFQVGAQLSFLATAVFLWFDQRLDVFGNLFGRWFERDKIHGLSAVEDKEIAIDESAATEMLLVKRRLFRLVPGFVRNLCRVTVNGLCGTVVISTMIWLIVSPLIASQMHVFSPVAILINPLLWLPLTLALLSGFGVMIFGWLCPPVAVLFGKLADGSYAFLADMVAWFHEIPHGYYWVPGFRGWWLIGFYVPFLIMALFPRLRPKRRWLVVAATCWLLVAFAAHYVRQWDDWRNDRLYVRVLSVGHGLCVHVKTPDGRSFFYDVGSLSSPFKSANVAAHSLWDVGGQKIDAVIISHPDSDHFNGLSPLLEKFPVDAVYVSPYMFRKEGPVVESVHDDLASRGIAVVTLGAGDVIERPGFPVMRVLHPPLPDESQPPGEADSNANSLVLLIEHRGHRVLLPGDVESERTLDFLREPPVHVDVMLSPHHGSVKKTADEMVAWASPDYVVISGGLFTYNPQSKPHFEQSGCEVYETLKNGMVEAIIDRNGIRVRPWR